MGDLLIIICQVTSCDHLFKGYVTLWMEAPHSKLSACHVWYPWVM